MTHAVAAQSCLSELTFHPKEQSRGLKHVSRAAVTSLCQDCQHPSDVGHHFSPLLDHMQTLSSAVFSSY